MPKNNAKSFTSMLDDGVTNGMKINRFDYKRLQARLAHEQECARINGEEIKFLRDQLKTVETPPPVVHEKKVTITTTPHPKRVRRVPERFDELGTDDTDYEEEEEEELQVIEPTSLTDAAFVKRIVKTIHLSESYRIQIKALANKYFTQCRNQNVDPHAILGDKQQKIIDALSAKAASNRRKLTLFFEAVANQ